MATKPQWCLGMLGTRRREFRNIVGHVKGVENMASLSAWTASQFDPTLSWDDLKWIKVRWGGKIILKGILDAEDAELAVKSGADALVVSNHGGRQLDGAPSSIAALPAIAEPSATGSTRSGWMAASARPGRAQGDRARREGRPDRRAFVLWPRRHGRGGGGQGAGDHPQGARLSMAFCGRTDIRKVDRAILLHDQGTAVKPLLPERGDGALEIGVQRLHGFGGGRGPSMRASRSKARRPSRPASRQC